MPNMLNNRTQNNTSNTPIQLITNINTAMNTTHFHLPLATAALSSHPPHMPPPPTRASVASSTDFDGVTSHDMHTATIAGMQLKRYQVRTILQHLNAIQSSTSLTLQALDSLEVLDWPVPTPLSALSSGTSTHKGNSAEGKADVVVAQHLTTTATMRAMASFSYYPRSGGGLFVNPALFHTELQALCAWFSRHHNVPSDDPSREVKILKFLHGWYVSDFLPPVLLLTDVLTGALEEESIWALEGNREVEMRMEEFVACRLGEGEKLQSEGRDGCVEWVQELVEREEELRTNNPVAYLTRKALLAQRFDFQLETIAEEGG